MGYCSETTVWNNYSNTISVKTFRFHLRWRFMNIRTRGSKYSSGSSATWTKKIKPDERGWRSIDKDIPLKKYVTPKKSTSVTRTLCLTPSHESFMCTILCQINSCPTTLETRDHVTYQQYDTTVLDWIAVSFSIKDSPPACASTISFWNRFGERRFTILWVMPSPPCQICSNHVVWGGYVLNPPSVFTPTPMIWLMFTTQGHFQRL